MNSTAADAGAVLTCDPASGTVGFASCAQAGSRIQTGSAYARPAVDEPGWAAIPPDGRNVYVNARHSSAGRLLLPLGIVFRPDGRAGWIAAFGNGAVTACIRGPASGVIRTTGPCIAASDPDCETGRVLSRAGFAALSADGRRLDVDSPSDNAGSVLIRRVEPLRGRTVRVTLRCDNRARPFPLGAPGGRGDDRTLRGGRREPVATAAFDLRGERNGRVADAAGAGAGRRPRARGPPPAPGRADAGGGEGGRLALPGHLDRPA